MHFQHMQKSCEPLLVSIASNWKTNSKHHQCCPVAVAECNDLGLDVTEAGL